MGYITIQEYIKFDWGTTLDSNTSSKIQMYIDSTTEIINAVTGDLTSSDKTEQVSMEDIIQTANDFPTLQLKNINVTAVKTINGNTFTGVEDVDWQIIPPMKSRFVCRYLTTYLSWLLYKTFKIVYTSWFTDIPNDIKQLQYMLIKWEMSKEWNQEVKSYSLWPRSITFKDSKDFDSVMKILSKYTIPNL